MVGCVGCTERQVLPLMLVLMLYLVLGSALRCKRVESFIMIPSLLHVLDR
jgi:hypothetical protein